MIIRYKNKKIKISLKKVSFLGKFSGLMFRTKKTRNLLFEFENKTNISIHSLFVFFKFLAIWLDDKNQVLEFKIVKPFRFKIHPNKKYYKLIEVPVDDKNKEILRHFVGRRKI